MRTLYGARLRLAGSIVVGIVAASAVARADEGKPRPVPPPAKKPAQLEIGLTAGYRFVSSGGFVDDPVATDGKRLAFVVADTARAELHAVDVDTGADLAPPIDITKVTQKPIALTWIGDRVLVVGESATGQQAALFDLNLKRKPLYLAPLVDHSAVVVRDGKPMIALHKALPTKGGVRHTFELRAADTGKRVGKTRTFDVDSAGKNAKLDFTVNHWTTGWTRAVGIKGGEWVKAENQRSPDVEATYDLFTATFVATAPIPDLLAQRKRFGVLEVAGGKDRFVKMSQDLAEIELWQDGVKTVVTLDQPLVLYGDARRSLDVALGPKGAWIAAQIDPVNVEAVKKQKADVEYWDLFEVDGARGKATRRARIWAGGTRYRFGFIGDRVWVIERNIGFDRGGKSLTIYTLTP